jgi:hypothetical protein
MFYSTAVENGEIPDILKLGYICPILKPESSRQLAASCRLISLTCHVIKTLERVIRGQIVCYLEHNQMMDPDQHGSRQRQSCLSQLLCLAFRVECDFGAAKCSTEMTSPWAGKGCSVEQVGVDFETCFIQRLYFIVLVRTDLDYR